MSATGRGATRIERDAYPTPDWCTAHVLDTIIPKSPGLPILDPCAGEGAILRVAKERGYWPLGIEIRPECEDELREVCGEDGFAIADALEIPTADLTIAVVTNPPFALAEAFIRKYAPGRWFAAFLLRLNYLAPAERLPLWKTIRPREIWALPNRPAFVSVCKGTAARSGSPKRKGCGTAYPLGATGACLCGGTIGRGSDATEYAWMVFGGNVYETRFDWLPLR